MELPLSLPPNFPFTRARPFFPGVGPPEPGSPREEQLEFSRRLRDAYESRKRQRRRRLFELLGSHNRNNLVLVMTLNKGHSDLLLNWIRSCDEHGIEVGEIAPAK